MREGEGKCEDGFTRQEEHCLLARHGVVPTHRYV
jgi:hypothetical protein